MADLPELPKHHAYCWHPDSNSWRTIARSPIDDAGLTIPGWIVRPDGKKIYVTDDPQEPPHEQ
jgi:hypothetical protein